MKELYRNIKKGNTRVIVRVRLFGNGAIETSLSYLWPTRHGYDSWTGYMPCSQRLAFAVLAWAGKHDAAPWGEPCFVGLDHVATTWLDGVPIPLTAEENAAL